MTKLTDTQCILLSSAAQRGTGSVYPLPTTITTGPGPIARTLNLLAKRGLVEERETSTPEEVWRVEEITRYGIFVTAAGLVAIGVDDRAGQGRGRAAVPAPAQTKAAQVLALLGRSNGATLPELIAATGWLPHTTRAFLTALRKKGHTLTKSKREDATCYRIVEAG
ncbi:DUF3489 domain-containing protein [Sphingomonas sp. TZW2008]|uniref:DUF3489 domain-containing protein n=1 Tax=Sphingomonas sp. TZW2008 TaxID=1917973 RepID=UPI000A269F16|nr:DUF3489 domain-containing protein [Sphingomonas sp. TZW2008]